MNIKKQTKTVTKQNNKKTQKKATKTVESLFINMGFDSIKTDGIMYTTIGGETSDIDHIFIIDNLIVLCETTGTSKVDAHFPKKFKFYNEIFLNLKQFINHYKKTNDKFNEYMEKSTYQVNDFKIHAIYVSENEDFNDSTIQNHKPFKLISPTTFNYFLDVTKTIKNSARFEIFKFLGIKLSEIGPDSIGGNDRNIKIVTGLLLPDNHTKYPDGFSIVSFYIDPASLLERAFVLRRDGWENSHITYQRFLIKKKIDEMRTHLIQGGKVFINNLIITLPSDVDIKDENGQPLDRTNNTSKKTVELHLEKSIATIGIIDGQHRVFAYYEDNKNIDRELIDARKRQNLLATAIIFPPNYTEAERSAFEAQLFLEINTTQSKISPSLIQELEIITKPDSNTSLARQIVNNLALNGPLKGLIQNSIYDTPEKIRTAAIVKYALSSLVDPKGQNSLFNIWEADDKDMSKEVNRNEYIEFCTKIISQLLSDIRTIIGPQKAWATIKNNGILSPTSIAGITLYLRNIIRSGSKKINNIDFINTFQNLTISDFESYRSSKWSLLSEHLFKTYPPVLKKNDGSKQENELT